MIEPDTTVLAIAGAIVGSSLLYGWITSSSIYKEAVHVFESEEDEDDMYSEWEDNYKPLTVQKPINIANMK